MINRKALMLSIGITTFVIVLIGGVYAAYATAGEKQSVDMTVEELLDDPEVQAVLQEREAAYQQLIDEANQRLEAQSQEAESQETESEAEEYPISVGLAVALAQDALGGGTLIRNVELVSVNGRVAYELIFDRGEVYIDAVSGAILYNSSASEQMADRSRSHDDDDHEHEGDDDD